ncbi:AarF/UbiB family protein [Mesorhizobium sp. M1328]|uniref:AarF/UbiB family protein n=1 Tax=Mesorhizobium sp. M1328 TaxID=2957082 RepID=UPI00333D7EF1
MIRLLATISLYALVVRISPRFGGTAVGRYVITTLARQCAADSPAVIKIAQLISGRAQFSDRYFCEGLLKLQADVSPNCWFRGEVDETWFAKIDQRALASGSVGSVFRATLLSGAPVVIKVKDLHREEKHLKSARTFRSISTLANRIMSVWNIPALDWINALTPVFRGQFDFDSERANALQFAEAFRRVDGVVIPRCYAQHSNPVALVYERIEELAVISEELNGTQRGTRAADILLKAYFKMVFIDGLIHCDLHAGNVYLNAKGDVVILDYGYVERITDRVKVKFRKFFGAIVSGNSNLCAALIVDMATSRAKRYKEFEFFTAIGDLVEQFHGRRAGDVDVGKFIMAVFVTCARSGVRVESWFANILVSLAFLQGTLVKLDSSLDFQLEAKRLLHTLEEGAIGL